MSDIREMAADASGAPITDTLQSLIDTQTGPLHIRLGAGRHVSGGVRLRSDLTLELAEGAEWHFIPDYDAYAHTTVDSVAEDSDRAMLVAKDASNIVLIGAGRIVGHGAGRYVIGEDADMGTLRAMMHRPRTMVLDGCAGVRLEGVTVDDSPMWTLHLVGCRNVVVRGITVNNDRRMPNTDGIVIDGCRDVTIEGSTFRTADDGIVLKTTLRATGAPVGPCENIRVSKCTIESRSCALKLGTESFSAFRNIVFEDIRVEKSNRALGIFSRDGGVVEDIRFSRIDVDCAETPAGFWGSGEPVTINTIERRPELCPPGKVRNVVIEDITGISQGAINIVAERAGDISDITLRRIALRQVSGPIGTGMSYDIRPTTAGRFDLFRAEGGEGRVNAWRFGPDGRIIGLIEYPGGFPGIFAKSITGLVMEDISVSRPDPLPTGWNPRPVIIA